MQYPFFNFITFILLCCAFFTHAQPNPEQWFDTQYSQAIDYCHANSELIESNLGPCCLPTNMTLAIAFPEMLRYTLWRDIFETAALELLYVNNGKQAADFSIGWLQMKPSFAELVENKISGDSLLKNKYSNLVHYTLVNTNAITIRSQRVKRLKSFAWQLTYLSAFVDLNCEILQKQNIPINQFITYLSAAYNRGMENSLMLLTNFSKTKTFPYGPGRKNPFSYCEVAQYFYSHNNLFDGISQNTNSK